jgi:putative sterol carrier protein
MNHPPSLTLQQTLEAMPLVFNPQAIPGLTADIQFNVTGSEPGVYTLQIANNACMFHAEACSRPTLTINTPSEIWLGIVRGEINGQEALMKGLYSVQGDFSLLSKWGALFQRGADTDMQAPTGQRPAGPLPWSGTVWMTATFIPWIVHWITFDSFGLSPWVSIGLPWLLTALIVGYRLRYNRPDWLEMGGLAFFTLGGILTFAGIQIFQTWGSIWSNLFMGLLWLVSLLAGKEPLSMQYVKWNFDRRLWSYSLFIFINAAVSLVWGFQSVLGGLAGIFGIVYASQRVVFTILRYLTLLPAYYFTGWYPKAGMQKPVKDTGRAMRRLRAISAAGIVLIGLELAFSLFV